MLLHAVWVAANVYAEQLARGWHGLATTEATHRWIKQRTFGMTIGAYLLQANPQNQPPCPELLALACEYTEPVQDLIK